jgi:hypothetical protein
MKKVLLAINLALVIAICPAQNRRTTPVAIKAYAIKVDSQEVQIYIQCDILDGYHLYSIDQPAGSNVEEPLIHFDKCPGVSVYGKVLEDGTLIHHIDKPLGIISNYYEEHVAFTVNAFIPSEDILQHVKKDIVLTGDITYQIGDAVHNLPPVKRRFSIPIWMVFYPKLKKQVSWQR